MKITDAISLSLKSLTGHKIRTFLTSFSVFVGVFIIIILLSLSNGAQELIIAQITNQFDLKTIFVLRKGSLSPNFFGTNVTESDNTKQIKILDNQILNEIRNIEGVQFADPVINIFSRKLEFIDKNFDDRVVPSASGGGWNLREEDSTIKTVTGEVFDIKKDEIILTKDLVDAYGKDVNEVIGQKVVLVDTVSGFSNQSKPIPNREYTVVGVIEKIRNFVYILNLDEGLSTIAEKNNYNSVEEYINTVGYPSIYVKAKSENLVNNIAQEIKDKGFDASTLEDVLKVFNTLFIVVPIIFIFIGIVAIFVSSIGIINTMLMSVFERTRDIGVMKAVGARNKDILILFLSESSLIGFLGGLMAVVFSVIFMNIGNQVFKDRIVKILDIKGVENIFIFSNEFILLVLVFSILVGILAGLYPAIRAAKMNPVDALRSE